MTVRDIYTALYWHNQSRSDELEALMLNELRSVRWLAFSLLGGQLKKGTKITDLMPLPGDDLNVKVETEEDRQRRKERFARWDAEMKKNGGGH